MIDHTNGTREVNGKIQSGQTGKAAGNQASGSGKAAAGNKSGGTSKTNGGAGYKEVPRPNQAVRVIDRNNLSERKGN